VNWNGFCAELPLLQHAFDLHLATDRLPYIYFKISGVTKVLQIRAKMKKFLKNFSKKTRHRAICAMPCPIFVVGARIARPLFMYYFARFSLFN
jgi:hypothetical protein